MTQISGVKKVAHGPSLSTSCISRFGVKTDKEDLLSKVCVCYCVCVRIYPPYPPQVPNCPLS